MKRCYPDLDLRSTTSDGMESRQNGKLQEPRQPVLHLNDWNQELAHKWPAGPRPLSDIRELTEPSLLDAINRKTTADVKSHKVLIPRSSLKRGPSLKRGGSVRIVEPTVSSEDRFEADVEESSHESPASVFDNSSMYSIPFSSVPPRATSQTRDGTRTLHSARSKVSPATMHAAKENTIYNHNSSCSPVTHTAMRFAPVSYQSTRRLPSRTFVRTPQPRDILDSPTHRHPRVGVELQIAAPLFVGGGSIEGHVRVVVDDAEKTRKKNNLNIIRLAVDLVGIEETSSIRRSIFLALGTELLDDNHPPPRNMVQRGTPRSAKESSWTLAPSFTSLPFMLSLPLDTGPPPFQSKHARIRFVLCATMILSDSGKQYIVRCSKDIAILSTYDPEKALRSLPSSLTVCDEVTSTRHGAIETTKLTAGLHRQVWVSGGTIFVDIHVANNSRKTIRKLELSLERDILCYSHAAAATLEQSASQARIFESNTKTILSKSFLKRGAQDWTGVEAYDSSTRTCDLEVPRGHATVKCGKYFEVRYFLNALVSTAHTKLVSVQLPIILIHMNSLDVVPNSVAQVAAAIEEKRSHHNRGRSESAMNRRTKYRGLDRSQSQASPSPLGNELPRRTSKLQGRAFAAPRQQSLDRSRADALELHKIGALIDSSPRKFMGTMLANRGGKRKGEASKATIVSRPAREIHKQPSNLSLGGISVGSYTIFNDSSTSEAGTEYVTPPSKRKGRIFDSAGVEGSENDGGDDGHSRPRHTVGKALRMRSTRSVDSVQSQQSNMTARSRWKVRFGGGGGDGREINHAPGIRRARSGFGHRRQEDNVMSARALGLRCYAGGPQGEEQRDSSENEAWRQEAGHQPSHSETAAAMQTPPKTTAAGTVRRPSREGAAGLFRALSWRARIDDDQRIDRSRFQFKAVKKKGSRSGGLGRWFGNLRGGAGGDGGGGGGDNGNGHDDGSNGGIGRGYHHHQQRQQQGFLADRGDWI